MKKNYVKPIVTEYIIETDGMFLKGSVQTINKEFKGHTENYETESFDWDNISFE